MTILILLMEDMWDLIKPEKQVYPTICDGICLCIVGWLADFLHQKYCHFWSSRLLNNKNHLTESIQQEILDLHMTMKLMAYPVYIYIYINVFLHIYTYLYCYICECYYMFSSHLYVPHPTSNDFKPYFWCLFTTFQRFHVGWFQVLRRLKVFKMIYYGTSATLISTHPSNAHGELHNFWCKPI